MKKSPIVISAALLAAAMLMSSGCATVTRGTTEQITVTSDPTGASVRLSNGFTGITPATFTVPRKGDLMVNISKEGYQSQDIAVPTGLSGAGGAGFAGNILIGGIIGGGVDLATGATLSHKPNPVHAILAKVAVAPSTMPMPTAMPPTESAPNTTAANAPAPISTSSKS